MPKVKLQSSDGEVFDVDIEVARCSDSFETLLDNQELEEGEEAVIPVGNVHSKILEKVICWATHHKDDPRLSEEEYASRRAMGMDEISEWDAEFLKRGESVMYDLLNAANYLHINGLFELCCKGIADLMKGKTPEEIRNILRSQNDLTPDEEAKIIQENERKLEK